MRLGLRISREVVIRSSRRRMHGIWFPLGWSVCMTAFIPYPRPYKSSKPTVQKSRFVAGSNDREKSRKFNLTARFVVAHFDSLLRLAQRIRHKGLHYKALDSRRQMDAEECAGGARLDCHDTEHLTSDWCNSCNDRSTVLVDKLRTVCPSPRLCVGGVDRPVSSIKHQLYTPTTSLPLHFWRIPTSTFPQVQKNSRPQWSRPCGIGRPLWPGSMSYIVYFATMPSYFVFLSDFVLFRLPYLT